MRSSKLMLALMAIVGSPFMTVDCSAADSTQVTSIGQNTGSQSDVMMKKLSMIMKNFKADPGAALTDQNVSDLIMYATDSTSPNYDPLSKKDRIVLSQIVNLNADRFSPSVIMKFNNAQKLAARMSTQDIEALRLIVVAIRDGQSLTERQVSDLRDFKTMVSRDPYAFIPDIYITTQYVAVNQNLFSSSDLAVFRQASRDASGITSDDMVQLVAIANRGSTVLNQDDIAVLTSFAIRGPIGSLNGLEAKDVLILNQIVNQNASSFSANSVSSFNRALNDNQAILLYAKANGRGDVNKSGNPTSAGQR